MPKPERRTLGAVELRASADNRKIEGHAALFNVWADIGGYFRERVVPGAFAKAIARDDVRGLFNHDSNIVLGRNKAGTLRLAEDSTGLAFEIAPPDTQIARDLVVSIDRGDVNQASFSFLPEVEIWDFTEDPVERSIEEVMLFDVSIVTYPAYDDTQVAVRSFETARDKAQAELAEARGKGPAAAALRAQLRMKHDLFLRGR